MMLLCFAFFGVARAQVTIGDLETAGDNTYLPMNSLYEYSYTQQIYTAEEIGTAGTINAITIWMYGAADLYTMPFDIYMVETDKESFASTSDWVSVTSGDIVYSGSVTVHNTTAEAYTFTLATPFAYSGTGNLLIAFDNNCGQWKGGLNGKVFTATDNVTRSIYARRDSNDYDPTNMSSISATGLLAQRNVIEIDITAGSGPTCDRPESLVVSDITGYGATCTWESNVGNYTFEYKKAADSEWRVVDGLTANTYTLSDLEPMTAYNTRVKAVCDAGLESGYRTANFTTKEVCPDGKICIGEGTATHTYLPTTNYYNYSLTEQIYTAEEIGQAGAILSVDIYSVGTATRTLEFYMVSTEKETFTDGTDWIAATASNLVYNGSVTFAANSWNTIEFDNPFIYDGHSNVALIVRDMTGSYVSSINFYVFDATSQAIYFYRDGSPYDLAAPGTGAVLNVKNRVRLVVGEPPACPKPTALAVDYQGGTEATISWTSDATAWNMRVNGTEINGTITNPYTLTGLELATTYEVEVQANCGDATSEWAGPVSFTTDNCMPEDQCALTFVVTDSYGDGWNGASIQIYDYTGEELGDLLATVANENLDGTTGAETQTITLNFCNGQELAIAWVAGNYDSECSYTITDINGDIVAQDNMELALAYTIDCTETDCRKPSDFVASEIGNHSVKLSWTENGPATEWVIAYLSENDEEITEITVNTNPYTLTGLTPETAYAAQVTPVCEVDKPSDVIYWTTDVACPNPYDLSVEPYPTTADVTWTGSGEGYTIQWAEAPATRDGLWLQYDNGTQYTSIGSTTSGVRKWGVMYPAAMLEGNNTLTKVAVQESSTYYTCESYTIKIYAGADQPETLLGTETVVPSGETGMHEITLSTPITINPTQNLWITLEVEGTYVMLACQSTERNNQWWDNNSDGVWTNMADDNANLAAYGWMIRGYVEGFDATAWDWNSATSNEASYTITGLEPETTYAVRVQSNCGEDGESGWTWAVFTTPSACDMPNTFNAEAKATSATLSWVGYQESYILRYRHAEEADPTAPATIILEANDVWEDGSGYQMLLDADASAYGVLWNANHYILLDGEQYSSGDLPEEYYNEFEYKIPTEADGSLSTTNVVVTGSVTLQIPAGTYDYAIFNPTPGDRFYIAADAGEVGGAEDDFVFEPGVTYHFTMQRFGDNDGAALVIDRPMTDWTEVTVNEVPYTLTGLTPETYYEWQIQGVNASCESLDWTEIQNFTTLEAVTQTITLTAGTNWVSSYVEITKEDLQNALVAALSNPAGTVIKSQNGNSTYRGGRWRDQSFTWDVAKMYKIVVPEDCEITLTGMPINPAEHPITIAPNAPTWIGFPFAESMTPAQAIPAGFAVNADIIKGKDGNARYGNGNWRAQGLNSLEPGKGYMYVSGASVTEERTLVYPSASKAAKASPKNDQFAKVAKKESLKTLDISIIAPKATMPDIKVENKSNTALKNAFNKLFNK